jgi:hypothetical protein
MTARITPPGIEGTMMAFSTTLIQLNQFTIRNLLGVFINSKFVQVSSDNMDNYWVLTTIKFIGSLIPLTFMLKILPTNEQIKELQMKHALRE